MKIDISSSLAFFLYPFFILTAILPFSQGSFFDFSVLPIIVVYSAARFTNVVSKLSSKLPLICYSTILLFSLFIRFVHANDSDFLIGGTGLRLLMPVSFYVLSVDLYHYICNLNDSRKWKTIYALIGSYFLSMIVIMVVSLQNGIGDLGLGLSFPLYTETQVDRHVYGPAIASMVIFCILALPNVAKNLRLKNLLSLNLIAVIIGFFSSVASGSRSPFAMYSAVLVYAICIQLSRSKILPILRLIALIVFSIILVYLFRNLAPSFESLISRALGVFEAALDPASDHSRGGIVDAFIEGFSNPDNWLFGASNVVSAADSGILNLLLNGGIPLVISFLWIWLSVLYSLPYCRLKLLLMSIFVQFLLGSETLFIPRYFLVASFPALFLALLSSRHSFSAINSSFTHSDLLSGYVKN